METARVFGTVTLDGTPLTGGMVVFTPEKGRGATGKIQSDGRYALSTYRPNDGAVLGMHRVAVAAREVLPGDGPTVARPGRWLAPEFYSDYTKSGLTCDVKSGTNTYDIKLSTTAKPTNP